MGKLIDWLLEDNQQDLWNFLVALALDGIFLGVIALLLWPLDQLTLIANLAKGLGLLLVATISLAFLLSVCQRLLGLNMYQRSGAYIASTLLTSSSLLMGWAAFTRLAIDGSLAGATFWAGAALYLIGLLACLGGYYLVAAFFAGQIYQLLGLPFILASYLVFSIWPTLARLLFGWLID
ncbi:MAG: hypothetical protein MUE67_06160 [Anaerolineales bacterium]|jgi:hypothetical protein|nr:hypothetical protein [Anaerolineales bacterium]